jgi:hypothetical protein
MELVRWYPLLGCPDWAQLDETNLEFQVWEVRYQPDLGRERQLILSHLKRRTIGGSSRLKGLDDGGREVHIERRDKGWMIQVPEQMVVTTAVPVTGNQPADFGLTRERPGRSGGWGRMIAAHIVASLEAIVIIHFLPLLPVFAAVLVLGATVCLIGWTLVRRDPALVVVSVSGLAACFVAMLLMRLNL